MSGGSSIYNSFSNLYSTTTTPYTQTTLTTNSTISDKIEYEKLNDNNNDLMSNSSLLQIQKLNEIEEKIGTLLKVASQAISVLSGDVDENIKNSFEELSVQYLDLVNDIQTGLRETFRFLTNNDIESTSFTTNLPYISNTYGEEKDHEISVKVLELVKTRINSILNSMGGSTIPLPISLSSSSLSSESHPFNMPSTLNNKFLNSRYTSNAELIANSLCSSNNNSNANIKADDELANDIAMIKKKQKFKKEEDNNIMDVDSNIKTEKDNIKSTNNLILGNVKKENDKVEMSDSIINNAGSFLTLGNDSNDSEIEDLDLDF